MVIFQDGGCCHLGFLKFQIFNCRMSHNFRTASLPNFVKIGQTAAEILRFLQRARNARIASAVLATAIPSVCPSVHLSVRHTPVLCQNDGT